MKADTGSCEHRNYRLIAVKFRRTEFWLGPRIFLELSVRLPGPPVRHPEPPVRRPEQHLLAALWVGSCRQEPPVHKRKPPFLAAFRRSEPPAPFPIGREPPFGRAEPLIGRPELLLYILQPEILPLFSLVVGPSYESHASKENSNKKK